MSEESRSSIPMPEWAELMGAPREFWDWWVTWVDRPTSEKKWRVAMDWAIDGWMASREAMRREGKGSEDD